jgi:hypothetical protein
MFALFFCGCVAGVRAAVLFNSSASWQASSAPLSNNSLGLPSVTTDNLRFNAMIEPGPSLCLHNGDTNNYIGLQHSRNGTMMLRLEVRHATDSELLVRVNGQVQISLYTDRMGVLKLDGFGPEGAAQNVPDPVLWAIGGVFRPPVNTTLFSIGCTWIGTNCHCYVRGGAFSAYKNIKDNQASLMSMNRIQGRHNANFCVRDVVVLDGPVDGAVVQAFVDGTGSNVDGITTKTSSTPRSPTSTTATATTIAPSSTSTVATVSAPVATTATATSSAATSSALIATVIASTSATGSIESSVVSGVTSSAVTSSTLIATVIASASSTGSIESWVVGVSVGGALLVLLLVGLGVVYLLKRRRAHETPAAAAELKPQSEYGRFVAPVPSYGDVADVRAPTDVHIAPASAAYGVVKVKNDYDAPDSELKM